MSDPVRVWIAAAYHPAFLCGGWAAVRLTAGQVAGAAGGERRTTAERMALAGLAWALGDLPPGGAVEVLTTSPGLAALAVAAEPPETDADLWKQVRSAAQGRRLSIVQASAKTGEPLAFATAWAELSRDKAKATGPFAAAIPKANLAKAGAR